MENNIFRVNIAGLDLAIPITLASGILGYSAQTLKMVEKSGVGAVITKSIGLKPRDGYANPTIVQTECGFINAMGLPNPGIDEFVKEVVVAKNVLTVPLIVSVFGFSNEEYSIVTKKATEAGADAVELNVSCPHVRFTGSEVGQNPKILGEVVKSVKTVTNKPVIVKLTPNVTDITKLATAACKAGADAISAINTVKAMAIDAESALPILGNRVGGLSGPAIKPIALRCVYELYETVKVPILGCGGITNWRDAIEFFLAGASAIQIGTAVALKDFRVFKIVASGIKAYITKKGFSKITEIVGLAHRR